MTGTLVREYEAYDEFVEDWHAQELEEEDVALGEARDLGLIDEEDTRLRWQLLGQLDPNEVLVMLPEWLAEEKTGFVDGAVPTKFVGHIERESEKAILLADATDARPLMRLAHRISNLEEGVEDAEEDRREWLQSRLDEKRREFEAREGMTGLQEEWLPKSQLILVIRRST